MWISSPESLTFDGGFKEVILLGELAEHDIAVIVYEGDRLVDGKPYYIGDYSATVTVGEYSLSVSYTVSHEHESLTHVYVDGENHSVCCVCGYTVLEPHVNEDALHSHCDICNERIEECNYTNGICEHGCLESPQRARDGYYEIANAGQLLYYFKNISVDEYTADFIRLIDDIDLSSVEWIPVKLKYGILMETDTR
jgi:hypothetical protein